MLRRAGAEVATAGSVSEARPHDKGGAIPAIALTAYVRAEDRARALAAGFDAHLAKASRATRAAGLHHRTRLLKCQRSCDLDPLNWEGSRVLVISPVPAPTRIRNRPAFARSPPANQRVKKLRRDCE
jgi:hypothetical protein